MRALEERKEKIKNKEDKLREANEIAFKFIDHLKENKAESSSDSSDSD